MKKPTKKQLISGIVTAFFAVVFLFVFGCLVSVFVEIGRGNPPTLFGYRFYNVVTDSMTPYIEVGDVIVAKTLTDEEKMALEEGEVITYIATEGALAGKTITHRIEKAPYFDAERNGYYLLTRGDKAGAKVDAPVPLDNVATVMVKKSAFITGILKAIKNGFGFVLLLILPLAVMLVLLVIRLVSLIKQKDEEDMKKGLAEQKQAQEERVETLRREAIEEYLKKQAIEEYERKESTKTSFDDEE